MDAKTISTLVRDELAAFIHEPPPPGTTIGVPWSAEKVYAHVEKLREALVAPYPQRFLLRETYEQVTQDKEIYAEYWVVAVTGSYLEWFDAATREFGLGQHVAGSSVPISIGCRGDLVGVFCAM